MSPIQFHLRPRSTSANAPFSVDYGSFRRQVGLSYVDRFFCYLQDDVTARVFNGILKPS